MGFWNAIFSTASKLVSFVKAVGVEIRERLQPLVDKVAATLFGSIDERIATVVSAKSAADVDIRTANDGLQDLEERYRSDGRLAQAKLDEKLELEDQLRKAAAKRNAAIIEEAELKSEAGLLVPIPVTERTAQVAEAYLGQSLVDRVCSQCKRPMFLQRQLKARGPLDGFFWSCSGYYVTNDDGTQACKNAITAYPQDFKLLVDRTNPDFQEAYSTLTKTLSDKAHVARLRKGLREHLGRAISGFVCPMHQEALYLRRKSDPLDFLDEYHLRCGRKGCGQIVKLKTIGQISIVFNKTEGGGVLA